jgi:hypothetical protein
MIFMGTAPMTGKRISRKRNNGAFVADPQGFVTPTMTCIIEKERFG